MVKIYNYDKSGNLTQDATGQQFLYDAENHQKEVRNSSGAAIGFYHYDGDGRRVKKVTATETTVFAYNAGGTLIAEYSNQISQTPQVSYLTADHLGSPRIITDSAGAVTKRQDYTAFGEETITAQRGSRTDYAAQNPSRKDYTGYEKDTESGLEFAQARYYNASHGRFTSVDPLTASATIKNPQTFNRYSYVLNSPYKFTDPLGLLSISSNKDLKFEEVESSKTELIGEMRRQYALMTGSFTGFDEFYVEVQRQQEDTAARYGRMVEAYAKKLKKIASKELNQSVFNTLGVNATVVKNGTNVKGKIVKPIKDLIKTLIREGNMMYEDGFLQGLQGLTNEEDDPDLQAKLRELIDAKANRIGGNFGADDFLAKFNGKIIETSLGSAHLITVVGAFLEGYQLRGVRDGTLTLAFKLDLNKPKLKPIEPTIDAE